MGKSRIDISGYTSNSTTLKRDGGTWQLLDDRIIFCQKGLFGKIRSKEVYLKDICEVDDWGLILHIGLTDGSRHALARNTLETEDIAFSYIMESYGDKYQHREKVQKLNEQVENNQWSFPCVDFYRRCQASSITALNNEFSIKKATQIAEALMMDLDICLENAKSYLSAERLGEFLQEGHKLTQKEDERIRQEKLQPRDAKCAPDESTFLRRVNKISGLCGMDKRKEMLSNFCIDLECKINAMREGEKALLQLGVIYADQQQKESDWAIIGGITEGIAGPAAGVMAAAKTIAGNAKVREHNAAIRKASMNIMSGVPSLAGDRYRLEKEKESISQQLRETESKVVLSKPSAKDIWKNIQLGKTTVKRNPSGVLAVALPIAFKEAFVLDIPDGVSMVVEGTIKGEVWFEDQLVGDVYFPLPLYGIPSNMTAEVTLDGMCGRSVEFDGEYTVKIADDQNLWIMEA